MIRDVRAKKRGGDRRRVELPLAIASNFQTPKAWVLEKEREAHIRRVVERLTDGQREVVELMDFDGLSIEEVAQRLGLTKTAVNGRRFRAMETLRHWLGCEDVAVPVSPRSESRAPVESSGLTQHTP